MIKENNIEIQTPVLVARVRNAVLITWADKIIYTWVYVGILLIKRRQLIYTATTTQKLMLKQKAITKI